MRQRELALPPLRLLMSVRPFATLRLLRRLGHAAHERMGDLQRLAPCGSLPGACGKLATHTPRTHTARLMQQPDRHTARKRPRRRVACTGHSQLSELCVVGGTNVS